MLLNLVILKHPAHWPRYGAVKQLRQDGGSCHGTMAPLLRISQGPVSTMACQEVRSAAEYGLSGVLAFLQITRGTNLMTLRLEQRTDLSVALGSIQAAVIFSENGYYSSFPHAAHGYCIPETLSSLARW